MGGCHCQGDEGHLHHFQDTQGQRKTTSHLTVYVLPYDF